MGFPTVLTVFALCIVATLAMPQQFNWNNPMRPSPNPNPNQVNFNPQNPFLPPAPTVAPTVVAPTQVPDASSTTAVPTTASPRYLDCFQRCPSTMEYNPICGTDGINYHNNGRLECARRCGRDVAGVRSGVCAPL